MNTFLIPPSWRLSTLTEPIPQNQVSDEDGRPFRWSVSLTPRDGPPAYVFGAGHSPDQALRDAVRKIPNAVRKIPK